jgi:hypothetical protein
VCSAVHRTRRAAWQINASDLVRIIFRKPEIAVRAGGDVVRYAVTGRNRIFSDCATGRDDADLIIPIRIIFREPEIAIRARSDGKRTAATDRDRIFINDCATGCDDADLVRASFCKPQVVIGTGGDTHRLAVTGRDRKLSDRNLAWSCMSFMGQRTESEIDTKNEQPEQDGC